jgi:DNA polymerase-3 subunit chi
MTRVSFYHRAPDRLDAVCKIAHKAHTQGLCVLIRCQDAAARAELDRRLWTTPALSFTPHVATGAPLARDTPVLIGDAPDELARPDVLINLDDDVPPWFARFERLVEIVSADGPDVLAARERYKHYKTRGYPLDDTNLAAPPHG